MHASFCSMDKIALFSLQFSTKAAIVCQSLKPPVNNCGCCLKGCLPSPMLMVPYWQGRIFIHMVPLGEGQYVNGVCTYPQAHGYACKL